MPMPDTGKNVASPTDKDGILDCPEQIQLTEIECQWNSHAEPRSSAGPQSQSVGFAIYESLSVGDAMLYILCCWEDF